MTAYSRKLANHDAAATTGGAAHILCQEELSVYPVIDIGYRMDLLVGSQLVVELKSVELILPIHRAQLLTYIKLAKKKLGLLINFNVPLIKEGIVRMIN